MIKHTRVGSSVESHILQWIRGSDLIQLASSYKCYEISYSIIG